MEKNNETHSVTLTADEFDNCVKAILDDLLETLLDQKDFDGLITYPLIAGASFGMLRGKIFGEIPMHDNDEEDRVIKDVIDTGKAAVIIRGPKSKELPEYVKDAINKFVASLQKGEMLS